MIALSTVYNISKHIDPAGLIGEIKSLGFSAVEINIEVPENFIPGIAKKLKVVSVHNFSPKLDSIPEGRNIYSPYNFASNDKNETDTAVMLTKKTIDVACICGAKAIVIHSGEIEMEISGKALAKKYNETKGNGEYLKFLDTFLKERTLKSSADRAMTNLLKSFDAILNYAVKKNIRLGLENRFWANEIPSFDEYQIIFENFNTPSMGLWYDVGHSIIAEKQGLVKHHLAFLRKYSDRLIGIHLHDVIDVYDHKPPGTGEVNFEEISKFVKDEHILVNETHSSATKEELKKSTEYLRTHGFRRFIDDYSFEPATV